MLHRRVWVVWRQLNVTPSCLCGLETVKCYTVMSLWSGDSEDDRATEAAI